MKSRQRGDLKALVSTIVMFWIGAEDSREQRRHAPGSPIGNQAWADLIERYFREAHDTESQVSIA